MKIILLIACILGVAVCAPQQVYMEFDIRYAPAEAANAIPPGAPAETLEVLLPVDAQRHLVGGPIQGFIKQDIIGPDGKELKELYYPFGFDVKDPAAAVVPVVVADPVVPAAPAAPADPAAHLKPVIAVAASVPRPRDGGDDDEEDD